VRDALPHEAGSDHSYGLHVLFIRHHVRID